MNLNSVKKDARKRFSEVFAYLTYLSSLEPSAPLVSPSKELKIMKGLFYVHLYSAIEKTVNETIITMITAIKEVKVKNIHLKLSFNAIALHSKLQSFKACKNNDFFSKANEIFDSIESDVVSPLNESMFGNYLQNIWYKTIEEIIAMLKIECFMPEPESKLIIDEIVGKRNAVAHGRISAEEVGQSHTSNVLRDKMANAQTLVFLFIDTLEHYLVEKEFIRDEYKSLYLLR